MCFAIQGNVRRIWTKWAILLGLIMSWTLSVFGQPTNAFVKPMDSPQVAGDPLAVAKEEAGLPRVLIIGDSISIGYTVPVRNLLKGKANVQRIPENGGPTTAGLASLKKWLASGKWDVIHFNWGLHDLKIMPGGARQVPLEEYRKNLRELVHQLQATEATLIWATTTPVPKDEARLAVKRHSDDVASYNTAALEIMEENHVRVDDLYRFALPRLVEIQKPADVHYTTQGYAELAKQVAASIEASLPRGSKGP
jgi:acyl-CoA thioesterase-1